MASIKDYKITIIGDSISKGVILNDGHVDRLETNAVEIVENYFNIKIENNSIFGQSLKKICEKKIIDKYINSIDKNASNLVVISLGGNDCDFNWKEVALSPHEYHSSKTEVYQFKEYLEKTISDLQENNVLVVLTTLFPICSERYFNNVISKICDNKNVLSFLNNDISNINRHQEGFNDLITSISNKYHCKLIDIRTAFLMKINYLDYVAEDGAHPNLLGQKLIGEEIIKSLENNL